MTIYCEATHPNSSDGCYEPPNHTGQHRGFIDAAFQDFYWSDEPGSPALTEAEVGILLTCLQPVTAFFPELVKKLEGMK